MKKVSLAILAVTIFGVAAHAQNRVFDNFDRTQGVSVYREPLAEPPASIPRRTKRGKYEVVVKDNLVKKTAQTAAVTDGFASRDAITRGPATRFAMGSSINLK